MYDFRFKPFEEMTDEDYEKVGFKSGLEIHQQLLTEKKTVLQMSCRDVQQKLRCGNSSSYASYTF